MAIVLFNFLCNICQVFYQLARFSYAWYSIIRLWITNFNHISMINQKKLGQKIKELREMNELSQDELAKKLDLSRPAISEIERGNRAVEALELAKIADIFKVDIDHLLRDEEPVESKQKTFFKNNFKFNPGKLKNLILYILEKCGGKPNIGETVLYKLLYNSDFDCFEVTGKPITGMDYVHIQFGPVPVARQYSNVIKDMIKNDELKIFTQQYFGLSQKRYVALKNYDTDILNDMREIKVIDEVIACLSDKTATQIEDYVHEDAPCKLTDKGQIIPYELVFQRAIPYAHNDYGKMWQNAGAEDTLKALGDMSEAEFNYYKNIAQR